MSTGYAIALEQDNGDVMMVRWIPGIFVVLWSSGFIGAKFGLPYAEPFTLLLLRMLGVVPLFMLLHGLWRGPRLSWPARGMQLLIGLLIHGCYLGGVFAAIDDGMPAGLTALLVSLNPLVVGALSGPVLGSWPARRQWLGLLLGMLGVVMVLVAGASWQGNIHWRGISWILLALAGICGGTLLQKRYAGGSDLIGGALWQYSGALLFFWGMSRWLETGQIQWTTTLVATVLWLVVALSVIAILLLMYMLRHGEATRVASYFYLVPPLAALESWLWFGERWTMPMTLGAGLVIAGLWWASRSPARTPIPAGR